MKKILFIASLVLASFSFTACDLNYVPSDELSADVLLKDEGGAKYILDGCYALLKDEVEFIGYASGNAYVRHYFQMTEFPADNVCLSGVTPDPLYNALSYKMTDDLKNLGTLWYLAYKAISMTNTVIDVLPEGKSTEGDQLLGEAYFLRGLLHTHLVTLWAKPYSFGRDNLGVIIRNSSNSEVTKRATVGECYDQIESDLKKASELMKPGVNRGNSGYGTYEAAMGLLSRIYLYEERYDDVITTVNTLLGGATADSKLDHDFANYFANALTSKETLFCVAHTTKENKGQSSGGSMYNADGGGWGEIYPSDPLLNLFERYPMDVRYTGFIKPQVFDDTKTMVTFPVFNQNDESGRANLIFQLTADGDGYKFDGGTVTKKTVNGEYTEWEANYGGEKIPARVSKQLKNRNNYYIYYVTKFGYQDGIPTLSSPVMLRWGEVILNRAEAYARKNMNTEALNDVNTMRTRAGIPSDGMFAAGTMHGYANVIDVVMDERRLELCFEGHRMFDVYRNKQNMDRRYPGCQPWEIVSYDNPRIQYPIPFCEYSVSGIEQNPGY